MGWPFAAKSSSKRRSCSRRSPRTAAGLARTAMPTSRAYAGRGGAGKSGAPSVQIVLLPRQYTARRRAEGLAGIEILGRIKVGLRFVVLRELNVEHGGLDLGMPHQLLESG